MSACATGRGSIWEERGQTGETESRGVGKTLTGLKKEQGAGEIVQQLHNPMFFQIILGLELPAAEAAAGLHHLASDRCYASKERHGSSAPPLPPVTWCSCPRLLPRREASLHATGREGVGRRGA